MTPAPHTRNSHLLLSAEMALGHAKHILEEIRLQKRLGWLLADPDTIERLAAARAKSLIWC